MALRTRIWSSKKGGPLFTTLPKAVRSQLRILESDSIEWRLDGSVAEVRRSTVGGYRVYKSGRSSSLYVTIPSHVCEQLRIREGDRAEWELHGEKSILRRA